MKQLDGLTDSAAQTFNLVLDDGTIATMNLYFRPNQLAWFYDISYNANNTTFTAAGRQVVTSPNMVRQFRNQIPFGLAVTYQSNGEPTGQEDWVNGNATMYLLNQVDVGMVEMNIFPGD